MGRTVKTAVQRQGFIGWQYNTIGVSDAITMGTEGMRFSLQSREIIADSVETVTCAQHHDANICIAGCDKNLPGVIMGMARHNRPSIMIYGGAIRPGHSKLLEKRINAASRLSGPISLEPCRNLTINQQHRQKKFSMMLSRMLAPEQVPVVACTLQTQWRRRSKSWDYHCPDLLRIPRRPLQE